MYKNIVFDVDGTLINTEASILKALQKVLMDEKGEEHAASDLHFVLGIPGIYSIPKFGFSDSEKALMDWERYMKNYADLNSVYDGILTLIDTLKEQGVKLGIVTSRRDSECVDDPIFQSLKVHFDLVVTANHTEKHKPEGEPLEYFLKQTGTHPEDTLYIGDTIYDSSCASNAGVDFMLAGWGTHDADNIPHKDLLTHPYEILKYITRD